MTKQISLNLTLEELEIIDKYIELNDDTRQLFDKIQNAYPKSPVEAAYKRVYGWYPPTTPSVSNYEDNRWSAFQSGYSCGYGDGLENSNDFAIPKKIVDKPEEKQQPNGDFLKNYPDVTRVEVIGNDGREFVHYGCSNVSVSLQDDGRTIKVFLYTMFQQKEND